MATSLTIIACCLTIIFFLLWFMAFKVTLIKKILGICLCLCVSLFSFFGFLASFEPGIAHAYWQLYEATGEERHYQGLVRQYQLATEWSPDDATAWYNLAVHVYNRGVAVMRTLEVRPSTCWNWPAAWPIAPRWLMSRSSRG